jgi:hypothetical protein
MFVSNNREKTLKHLRITTRAFYALLNIITFFKNITTAQEYNVSAPGIEKPTATEQGRPSRGTVTMSESTDVAVKILVKSVYERNLSITLDMISSETILNMKEQLQEILEYKPLPKDQRLIFGGKICDNIQTLAQVLKRVSVNKRTRYHYLRYSYVPDRWNRMRSILFTCWSVTWTHTYQIDRRVLHQQHRMLLQTPWSPTRRLKFLRLLRLKLFLNVKLLFLLKKPSLYQ